MCGSRDLAGAGFIGRWGGLSFGLSGHKSGDGAKPILVPMTCELRQETGAPCGFPSRSHFPVGADVRRLRVPHAFPAA